MLPEVYDYILDKNAWFPLLLGIATFYIVIILILPLFFIEFEQSFNGQNATVIWGLQFWQSYLIIGFLILGFILREKQIKGYRLSLVLSNLIILFLLIQLLQWPFAMDTSLVFGLPPIGIHDADTLIFLFIPMLGALLLFINSSIFLKSNQTLIFSEKKFYKNFLFGIITALTIFLFIIGFWFF